MSALQLKHGVIPSYQNRLKKPLIGGIHLEPMAS